MIFINILEVHWMMQTFNDKIFKLSYDQLSLHHVEPMMSNAY